MMLKYSSYIFDVLHDSVLYVKYSDLALGRHQKENLSAKILAHVHSVERAFSLANTRDEFGVELVESLEGLISLVDDESKYQYELKVFSHSISEYYKHHNIEQASNSDKKPYKLYCHKKNSRSTSYIDVIKRRHSIRDFGTKRINHLDVVKAVALAKDFSPSVCNRQAWKVFFVKNEDLLRDALSLQNGNSGIEGMQGILVVCTTLSSFFGAAERHQPYVDGGIFLMSIINSLHYKNIAACCLNWSVGRELDKRMKSLLGIDESFAIISLVGLGSYVDGDIKVAASYKKPLKAIVEIIE